MGQLLYKDGGLKLDIDRTFIQGEIPPTQAMAGDRRIILSEGQPAKPTIHMRGTAFFYDDGRPVERLEDITHLPERCQIGGRIVNVREAAEAFVRAQQGEGPSSGRRARGGVLVRGQNNPRRLRPPAKSSRQVIEIKGSEVLGMHGGTRPERVNDPDRLEE